MWLKSRCLVGVGQVRKLRILCAPSVARTRRAHFVRPNSLRANWSNPIPPGQNKNGPDGSVCCYWRRGWDSNPRRATNPCWFSRPVHSTALPPLQIVAPAMTDQCIDSLHPAAHPLGCLWPSKSSVLPICDSGHPSTKYHRIKRCPDSMFSLPRPSGRASRVQNRSRRFCHPLCHLSVTCCCDGAFCSQGATDSTIQSRNTGVHLPTQPSKAIFRLIFTVPSCLNPIEYQAMSGNSDNNPGSYLSNEPCKN